MGDIHDFDFFVGNWQSTNHRLRQRWVGSNDWETFPCTIRCESRMDGVVNLDEGVFPTKGWSGMTLRLFNLKTRQWSLYWINSSTGGAVPARGRRVQRRRWASSVAMTPMKASPIKVVFRWTQLGPDAARWEQLFSLDGKELGEELDHRAPAREGLSDARHIARTRVRRVRCGSPKT